MREALAIDASRADRGGAAAPPAIRVHAPTTRERGRSDPSDAALSALLVVQALTLFVVLPLGAACSTGRLLLDLCHLAFAAICVRVLLTRRLARAALLATLMALALGPVFGELLCARLGLPSAVLHDGIALAALSFNAMVTLVVARQVFASGPITGHRVRGAVLLYLNVAALFSITYGLLLTWIPDAIVVGGSGVPTRAPGARTAMLTYFSLTTITTAGYGDVVPVHPIARSLANLEAVFGQLFPATLLTRLVAMQLAHSGERTEERSEAARG